VEVNSTICKLIAAGAVELAADKEPVFTRHFTDHITHSLATYPSRGETADGWSSIITTFNSSLREASLWDLGIIMSLVAYHMSFNSADDNYSNDIRLSNGVDSYN
jgi:hypothetical protein